MKYEIKVLNYLRNRKRKSETDENLGSHKMAKNKIIL